MADPRGLSVATRPAASGAGGTSSWGSGRGWARLAATAVQAQYGAVWLQHGHGLQLADVHPGAGPDPRTTLEQLRPRADRVLAEDRAHLLPGGDGTGSCAMLPLHGADGGTTGVLAVVGPPHRSWSTTDLDILNDTAALVSTSLTPVLRQPTPPPVGVNLSPVLDATPDAFVAADLTGNIVAWNAAAAASFGWSAAEAIGRPLESLLPLAAEQHWLREARRAVAVADDPHRFRAARQVTARRRDGHEFLADMVASAATTDVGAVFFAFLRDVTERVAVERALESEHSFMRALLDSLDVGVLACGADGNVVLYNEVIRDTAIPVVWTRSDPSVFVPDLYHPNGTAMQLRDTPLARAFSGQQLSEVEVVLRAAGSAPRYLSVNGRPIRDSQGERIGAVIAMHETTDRRRRERFNDCDLAIAKALAGASLLTDVAGSIAETLGRALDAQEVVLAVDDDVTGPRRQIASWVAGGPRTGTTIETPITIRARESGMITVTGCAEEHATDLTMAVAAQLGQFLERRHAEGLARELIRTRDEFIALAGHTLRTPLTSIASLTELLRTGEDEPADQRAEILDRIQANADALRGIVEDLLDLAGLESGHIGLMCGPVDLAAIVHDAVALATAGGDNVHFDLDLPAELPMNGDRMRLRQAVDNLVSNAVKYSPGGGKITVRLASTDGVAELTVADEGIGVPENEREKLFNRFFRGAGAHERGIPGTGLGLALTRVIVEKHGGSVTVLGDAHPGSTFRVRVPLVYDQPH